MKLNKKGQGFIILIVLALALMMFILSAPIIFEAIQAGSSSTGTATSFFVRSIPWIGLILLIGALIKLFSSGQSFI